MLGNIKGIAGSDQGLEEHFLIAAELGNIIKDFCGTFGIEDDQSRKTEDHYQPSGSKNARIGGNVENSYLFFPLKASILIGMILLIVFSQ